MKKVYLAQFMEKLIEKLNCEQRNGTAHVYQSTLNRFKEFMGEEDLSFQELNSEWLAMFEKKLIADQLTWNTISTYMRTLRSVYNQAVENGYAPYYPRLFNKVHTGVDGKLKRAVEPQTICRLMKQAPSLDLKIAFSRDMFLLLFMFRGMSFVDLAFLRRCDIKGNVMRYRRHKTGRRMVITISEEALEIITRNTNPDEASPYLFPIIKQPGKDEYRQYANMLRMVNYYLKQLADILEIKESISTYVARHTWATTALRQNFNTSLISNAMGHSSVKVTETYFKSFGEEEIDRMNNVILSYVLSHHSADEKK